MTEIARIRADRAWWEAVAPPGWALLGFSDRITATFIRQGASIPMCGVVAASIHERIAAARREALEEAAGVCEAEQERCERAASRESVRSPHNPYPYEEQGEKAGELAAAIRALAVEGGGDV